MKTTPFLITISDFRKANPVGFEHYLKDKKIKNSQNYLRQHRLDKISIEYVANIGGIRAALRALKYVEGCEKDIRMYANWCAKQSPKLLENDILTTCLDLNEQYAYGLIDHFELRATRKTARSVACAALRESDTAFSWAAAAVAWATLRKWDDDVAWAAARSAESHAWETFTGESGDARHIAANDAGRRCRAQQKDMLIKMCRGLAPWQFGSEE